MRINPLLASSLVPHFVPSCLRAFVPIIMLVLSMFVAGCPARPLPERERPYFGPTEPMWQVVEAINANNQLVPTLWARHEFEAFIVDPETRRTHVVVGDGALLYRRPLDMLLAGARPGARIFTAGSNGREYWFTLMQETMWWGRFEHLGKPCVGEMPVRPDLLLEVLGIREIETDFLRVPTPVMRFNNDADAYMFVWSLPLPDRWAPQKEIWYDRRSKLPTLVLLFDEQGRVVLRAYLMRHERVPVPGLEREQWPLIATDFRIFFPDTRSRMQLMLEEVHLQHRGLPADISFRFPGSSPREAGVDQVIQIDEDCE